MRTRSKLMQRETLARLLADARPTIDAVHDAVVQAGYHGLTYAALAGALQSTETRVQRWAVGADIPATVAERRAILSTISRLLHGLNGTTPVEVQRKQDEAKWRASEGRIRQATVLCMQCQRVAGSGDTCGRRMCRRPA